MYIVYIFCDWNWRSRPSRRVAKVSEISSNCLLESLIAEQLINPAGFCLSLISNEVFPK